MEQPKNVEAEKQQLVEFDNTPAEQLEEMAKNLMTEEEQKELMKGELDLILRIARKRIEKMENPPSIQDAIAEAVILRLGVREYSRIMAIDREGNIVGSGSSREEAIKRAHESTAQ